MRYAKEGVPLVVLAGKEYGSGSSRDWAAKGPKLLGVRAVIAESYERIHRSNLVGMGILPLAVLARARPRRRSGSPAKRSSPSPASPARSPSAKVVVHAKRADGSIREFVATVRIDTPQELEYYQHGGILQYVLRQLLSK